MAREAFVSSLNQGSFRNAGVRNWSLPERRKGSIDIGFVSLIDAAPLFVALDNGYFLKRGLKVALHREIGWASIREKILYNELDAAQALCSMPFSTTLGLNSHEVPCVTGAVISRGGCAITLSMDLWKRGVRDAQTLAHDIRNGRMFRRYTFATVDPYSTQTSLFYDWLARGGMDPERDAQLVSLPPSQMCRNLAAGTIDGFCAGEPWPTLAISQNIGWSPANSADIRPGHPEKVLMVKEAFAEQRHDEHLAMIAALIEGCTFCDDPSNHESIAFSLSMQSRVNCDPGVIAECLSARFNYGNGREEENPDFLYFSRRDANRPTLEHAHWILDFIRSRAEGFPLAADPGLCERVFRTDLYEEALSLVSPKNSPFGFPQPRDN